MERPVAGRVFPIIEKFGKVVFHQTFTRPGAEPDDFLLYGIPEGTRPALIFPINSAGKVVALRQFRFGADEFILELPGGCAKPGEEPREAVARELLEETGYQATDVIGIGKPAWLDPASLRVQMDFFLGVGCKRIAEPQHESTELAEIVEFPLSQWQQFCQNGIVTDMKSIALTMRALDLLSDFGTVQLTVRL